MVALFPVEILLVLLAASPDGGLDDADLARSIRAGDHAAFRVFFERHHQQLLHYLVRMGLSADAAADLVQQAFVMIWERRKDIDPDKSLRAFLFRIGHTRALNHIRDHRRFVGDDTLLLKQAGATTADPDRAAMMATLDEAVRELPERRRAVFELCFLQQLTYREAAESLGIAPKTVENHMGHALKAIRHALKHFAEDR